MPHCSDLWHQSKWTHRQGPWVGNYMINSHPHSYEIWTIVRRQLFIRAGVHTGRNMDALRNSKGKCCDYRLQTLVNKHRNFTNITNLASLLPMLLLVWRWSIMTMGRKKVRETWPSSLPIAAQLLWMCVSASPATPFICPKEHVPTTNKLNNFKQKYKYYRNAFQ